MPLVNLADLAQQRAARREGLGAFNVGVSDDGMRAAIRAGMTKVNVSTHLNVVFTDVVRQILASNPGVVDTRKYVRPALDAASAEVQRLLRWYAAA